MIHEIIILIGTIVYLFILTELKSNCSYFGLLLKIRMALTDKITQPI